MKIAVFYENIRNGAAAAGQDLAGTLAGLRADGMELIYLSPESWLRDRDFLAPLLRDTGIGVEGMHGFCDFPGDPETERWREMIDLALEAGARNLLFVPGMLTGGDTIAARDAIVRGLRKAAAYGREKGLPILLEDYDGLLSPYNSSWGVQYFLDAVEGLGCAFDTGNFVIFAEDELTAFERFASRIVTVHLKDRLDAPPHPGGYANICADGRPVYACAIGSGRIRIAEILRRLKARGYGGNVIVEVYGDDPQYMLADIRSSIAWLHEQGI